MPAVRTTWKTCAVGAAAIAALLATSACASDDKDDNAQGAAASASGTTQLGGSPGQSADATPPPGAAGVSAASTSNQATTVQSGATAGSSSGQAGDNNADTAPCTPEELSVVATVEPRDGARHVVLTATNTGAATCTLFHYPDVVLGDGTHGPVQPMESPAKEVATIAPGGKAYAGLLLFRIGEPVDTVTSMAVNLRTGDNDGAVGNPIDVPLPRDLGGFLNIGDGLSVTFWNKDRDAVYRYTFAR
ncbi:DUF4232 domain-containing protein [Yinghuangia sp. YIM S09857]|uniref:DUF4232 domain-containing protein n=1 Tax=Yinghuangia sp. YIM S09857 TaxID=3436929 RepID=UPI003F52FF5C